MEFNTENSNVCDENTGILQRIYIGVYYNNVSVQEKYKNKVQVQNILCINSYTMVFVMEDWEYSIQD